MIDARPQEQTRPGPIRSEFLGRVHPHQSMMRTWTRLMVVVPVERARQLRRRARPVVLAEAEADRLDFALLTAQEELHVVPSE